MRYQISSSINFDYQILLSLEDSLHGNNVFFIFIFFSFAFITFDLFFFSDPFKSQRSSSNNNNTKHNTDSHSTLYAIIISSAVLIIATIIAVTILLYRRYKKDRQKLDVTSPTSDRTHETFRERLGNIKRTSCELLFLSKEKDGCYQQQRYEPTTSARLFSLHSNDGNDGTQDDGKGMDGFASYVKVRTTICTLVRVFRSCSWTKDGKLSFDWNLKGPKRSIYIYIYFGPFRFRFA